MNIPSNVVCRDNNVEIISFSNRGIVNDLTVITKDKYCKLGKRSLYAKREKQIAKK